jgi:regulator of sirC expression with transglutaminase-like and TPR domain
MDLDTALNLLARDPAANLDLAELALLLARDEYPSLDVEGYLAELTAMARELRRPSTGGIEADLAALCRYLFHELGFHGDQHDYYDPRNSYLHEVLDRRMGLPITLSAVAMVVGQRCGIHVEGIGLPGHFIAKAVGDGREVLFDPFHGGRVLSVEECAILVERATGSAFEVTPESFQGTQLRPMVQRMLVNLKGAYLRRNDFRRTIKVLERLRQLDPSDIALRRDIGAAMMQCGQPGKAIDHLSAYLEATPQPADAELVGQVLSQARKAVAKWN